MDVGLYLADSQIGTKQYDFTPYRMRRAVSKVTGSLNRTG